jgi:ubiquitin carboxyl-terminal hydrolase 4/11/15
VIDFPIRGLNLAPYLVSQKENDREVLYDLYAISNHYGTLSGGHYTAYAKNCLYDKWYEFDDSYVSNVNETSLISNAAYVLFYKKRY